MDSRKGTADEFRDITYLEPWYTVRAHRSGKLVMAPRTTSDKFGRVFVSIRGRDVPLDYVIASAFIPNPDCCTKVRHLKSGLRRVLRHDSGHPDPKAVLGEMEGGAGPGVRPA